MIRFLIASISSVWLAFLGASDVASQTGATNRNIVPKGVSGYTVIVADDWVECTQGMYPVRVTIETNPPIAAVDDERFTVSLHFSDYRSSEFVVAVPAVILAGNKSATVELNVPVIRSGSSYQNRLLVEKGEYDGRLSGGDLLQGYLTGHNISYEAFPNLLLVSSTCPSSGGHEWVCYKRKQIDLGNPAFPAQAIAAGKTTANVSNLLPSIDARQAMYSGGVLVPQNNVIITRSVIASTSLLHEVRPGRLPQNWVGLLGVEQMLISMADLKLVCSQNESQRNNLEKWISAGGSLIVFDAGADYQEADKVWPMVLGDQRALRVRRNQKNWKVPGADLAKVDRLFTGVDSGGPTSYSQYVYMEPAQWFDESGSKKEAKRLQAWGEFELPSQFPDSAKLGISRYLNGLVVVVGDDMSNWDVDDWRLLQNSMTLANGKILSQRIGESTGTEPKKQFGIPGVGRPPVTLFQVLIGLFLLVSGPVMLISLKRMEQLQWMFVVVPAMSAVVCCSLFLFAVLVDGSKHWGRVQTVTTIDHRTDRATTYARAVYYAGRSPGPYQYADDTMALVANSDSRASAMSRYANGELAISGGDIRARTPHEVSTIRSRSTTERLVLIQPKSNEGEESPPSIQNRLGSDVSVVVFRDHDGELYVASDLESDQTLVGKKIPAMEMMTKVRQLVSRFAPGDIESYISADPDSAYSAYGRAYYDSANNSRNSGDVDRIVESVRRDIAQGWLSRPGTYVAILDELPLVADQIEQIEYKLQIHVVRGQW